MIIVFWKLGKKFKQNSHNSNLRIVKTTKLSDYKRSRILALVAFQSVILRSSAVFASKVQTFEFIINYTVYSLVKHKMGYSECKV